MKEFFLLLGQHPEALKVFIIGCFVIFVLIFLIIAGNQGWIRSFKAGKDGISGEFAKKENQKKFESGNVHKIMNEQIHKLDHNMLEFSLNKSNVVRRNLTKQLTKNVFCVSSRRALASCLRYPLYESAIHNNFKYVLRPENIKFYIDRMMKEIAFEYEEYSIEIDNNTCPVDLKQNCKPLPPLSDVFESIRKELVEHWAVPIRHGQIQMHHKKIEVYTQYAVIFDQLGDLVLKKICETCIDKNRNYIKALERNPELNEF